MVTPNTDQKYGGWTMNMTCGPIDPEILRAKIEKIMEIEVDPKKAAKFLMNEVKGYENKYKKRIWDAVPAHVLSLILRMEAGGIIDRKKTRKLVEDAFRGEAK